MIGPSFLVTGLRLLVLGELTLVWAAACVQRRHGGRVLTLFSLGLLLFDPGGPRPRPAEARAHMNLLLPRAAKRSARHAP